VLLEPTGRRRRSSSTEVCLAERRGRPHPRAAATAHSPSVQAQSSATTDQLPPVAGTTAATPPASGGAPEAPPRVPSAPQVPSREPEPEPEPEPEVAAPLDKRAVRKAELEKMPAMKLKATAKRVGVPTVPIGQPARTPEETVEAVLVAEGLAPKNEGHPIDKDTSPLRNTSVRRLDAPMMPDRERGSAAATAAAAQQDGEKAPPAVPPRDDGSTAAPPVPPR
jgi:hypothetical protein